MDRSSIDEARAFFLDARRIAVVGVSRDPKDFSRFVFGELLRRGHDVVPVNPALAEAGGVRAFARVSEVEPPADAALLMVPAPAAEEAVRDCLRARVHRIWLHRGSGPGIASEAILALCTANRVEVVHGLCPLMALPAASLPHRVHGLLRRIASHPSHASHPHACGMH
jgi:predicted CoA-binding protein